MPLTTRPTTVTLDVGEMMMSFGDRVEVIPRPDKAAIPRDPDFLVPYPPLIPAGLAAHGNHDGDILRINSTASPPMQINSPSRSAEAEKSFFSPDAMAVFYSMVRGFESGTPESDTGSRDGQDTFTASNGVMVGQIRHMPPLRMQSLSDAELDALGRCPTPPALHRPVVFFREEDLEQNLPGWMLLCLSPEEQVHTTMQDKHQKANILLRKKETRLSTLEAFQAASELQDINAMLHLFKGAKATAVQYDALESFAASLERLLPALANLTHSTVVQDLIYYAIDCGEVHEQLASMASSKQKQRVHRKAAILSYKMAAEATAKEGARFGRVCGTHAWNCFALSLKRAGEYAMAHRAYLWALDDARAPQSELQIAQMNLLSLMDAMSDSAAAAARNDQLSQAAQFGKISQQLSNLKVFAPGKSKCAVCETASERCLRCSKCKRVEYCSKDCQLEDWPAHKKDCKKWTKQAAAAQ